MTESTATVKISHCRSCGAEIYWAETRTGRLSPFDIIDGEASGRSHFVSCPDRAQWRKAKAGGHRE